MKIKKRKNIYNCAKPVKKRRSKFFTLLSIVSIIAPLYLLLLVNSPSIIRKIDVLTARSNKPITAELLESSNRVIIPKIGIDMEFQPGSEEVLQEMVWHRFPERGNPRDGGNFILSAHRFQIGLTPAQVAKKSPFYSIHKLNEGDNIYTVYDGKRYTYQIEEKRTVKPYEIGIESQSNEHIMTLYSCTFGGSDEGRDVLIARPVSEIALR